MKCAMHMHDPCKGPVRHERLPLADVLVPLCARHVTAWDNRTVPFRWQTPEQLERWARDAAARTRK